jgi:hypothetical protein
MTGASGAGSPDFSDEEAVRALLGRESTTKHQIALRCPGGGPAVLQNQARDSAGHPFPTRYWLACRSLSRAVARLEADGGVRELEQRADLADALSASQRRHAELHDGHFITGSSDPARVKCLHAHLAFGLVQGGEVGEWIWRRSGVEWPRRCCVRDVIESADG